MRAKRVEREGAPPSSPLEGHGRGDGLEPDEEAVVLKYLPGIVKEAGTVKGAGPVPKELENVNGTGPSVAVDGPALVLASVPPLVLAVGDLGSGGTLVRRLDGLELGRCLSSQVVPDHGEVLGRPRGTSRSDRVVRSFNSPFARP